jgi:hypothetical protein
MGAVRLEITALILSALFATSQTNQMFKSQTHDQAYMKGPCSSCWHGLQRMRRKNCQPTTLPAAEDSQCFSPSTAPAGRVCGRRV